MARGRKWRRPWDTCVGKHTSEHVRMDAAGRPKGARKRTSRSEDGTLAKRARVNGSLGEVLERDAARDNADNFDKNGVGNDRQDMFDGQSLRTLFSSTTVDLAVLRKFVTVCNENRERDLAAEYLLAGGSVLEVLKLSQSSDMKSTANATTVFSAVHILLMRYGALKRRARESTLLSHSSTSFCL